MIENIKKITNNFYGWAHQSFKGCRNLQVCVIIRRSSNYGGTTGD